MKKTTVRLSFMLFFCFLISFTAFAQNEEYHPNQVIVSWVGDPAEDEKLEVRNLFQADVISFFDALNMELWQVVFPIVYQGGNDPEEEWEPIIITNMVQLLGEIDKRADVNGGINQVIDLPPGFNQGIQQPNSPVLTYSPIDTNCTANVWCQGVSTPIKIGFIDSGLDPSKHGSIFVYYNGFDYHNYINPTMPPIDSLGHGTMMAGIVGGMLAQQTISGPEFWIAKAFNRDGKGSVSNVIAGINDAILDGVSILNLSLGYVPLPSFPNHAPLEIALMQATNSGMLLIISAGNSSLNNDLNPYYPASMSATIPDLFVVANSDCSNGLDPDSNFGATTVNIAAPGNDILCPTLDGFWVISSGSSHSTAITTGISTLLATTYGFNAQNIRCALMDSAVSSPGLTNKVISNGVVDAPGAYNWFLTQTCIGYLSAPSPPQLESQQVIGRSKGIQVFPNPTNGNVQLFLPMEEQTQANIQIFNIMAQPIYQLKTNLVKGNNQLSLDLKDLLGEEGMYLLKIQMEDMIITKPLIYQKTGF